MKNSVDWLLEANNLLAEFNGKVDVDSVDGVNVFIVGAPRSGTTILNQFIASCCDVGYVDNLMASFWQAPTFGAMLSEKLLKERIISASSDFGQTTLITDPHEFGGFWRKYLNYTGMDQREDNKDIDWPTLMKRLDEISTVKNKTMVYKVFQLYWHIVEFQKLKSNTKWIWIERNTTANIQSLLTFREQKTGSRNNWVSAKPLFSKDFLSESAEVQTASQVIGINKWLASQFDIINSDTWLKIEYETLVSEPELIIRKIAGFMGSTLNDDKLSAFIAGVVPISEDSSFQIDSSGSLHDAAEFVLNKNSVSN